MINVKFDFYDDHPIFHHQRSFPPLYPIILAVGHKIFGKSIYVNIFLTSFIGIMCVFPAYYLGKLLGNNLSGVWAAALTVFSPTLVEMCVLSMSEPLFTLLSLCALYFLARYEESEQTNSLVLAGIFSSLAYLTRTNGAAIILAAAFFLLVKRGFKLNGSNLKATGKEIIIYLGTAFIISFPWFLRNYLIFGSPFYYVGNFFAGLTPGKRYSAVYKTTPTLINYLKATPLQEILSRYAFAFSEHLKLIWREISVISLLALISLFFNVWNIKKRTLLAIWFYLIFNLLISLFHPSVYPRHIINIFPVLAAIASAWSVKFILDEKKFTFPYVGIVKITVLLVLLSGIGLSLRKGLTFHKRLDTFSEDYQAAGEWLKHDSEPGDVIMSLKTSPIAYYAERPVMMFPLNVPLNKFNQFIWKYDVKYIVTVSYKGFIPKNFIKKKTYYRIINNAVYAMYIYKRT